MIDQINKILSKNKDFNRYRIKIECSEDGIVTLYGEVDCWQEVVNIGHIVAKVKNVVNVVNNLSAKGIVLEKPDYAAYAQKGRVFGLIRKADIVIIGGGISGCSIARELSKYDLRIIVVEKGEDVAIGASKANNGNIHPGHGAKPGTLKAKLNVRGNEMYTRLSEELGFELQRCGSTAIISNFLFYPVLLILKRMCRLNKVPAKILGPRKLMELEPNLDTKPVAGLYLPTMGLVDPYEVVIALAENAIANGVEFILDNAVGEIMVEDGVVRGVVTEQGIIEADYVINCAGVYADDMAELAGDKFFTIHPRKGTIAILDKWKKPKFNTIAAVITKDMLTRNENTKGGGMCMTPHGNILLGPSAKEVPNKEDKSTDPDGLAYALSTNQNKGVSSKDVIRFFTGVRPADYTEDFIIGMSGKTEGFINVAAIQSPGLASAPAIAEMVESILVANLSLKGKKPGLNKSFNPIREKQVVFHSLSREEQDIIISRNPKYGNIICRCETISEGEILEAIKSPLKPTTVDAIKRRTRAGMGRCQGGFCEPRVVEILARELGRDWVEINLKGKSSDPSNILIKANR